MGMFDEIRSELPLPDGFDGALQTKSLDCLLSNLLITKAGRLLIEDVKYEEIPPEERKPGWPGVLQALRPVSSNWRDLQYHGDIRFYASERDSDGSGVWHEYVARFTDGQLQYIKVMSDAGN